MRAWWHAKDVHPIQGVFLPHDLCYLDGRQIHYDLHWEKLILKKMEIRTLRNYSRLLQTEPPRTTLFRKEISGITYRIPALIYIHDTQTFLAFAEKRTSPYDHDATLLVMRRGTRQNGSIQWSPVKELRTACLPGHRTMNPCPVYEKESKTLFLFFICVLGKTTEHHQICTGKNKARLCYATSKDSGQNWSSTVDLTESVIGPELHNWATFAVGPGHGIQMKSGRLIIPAYVYYIHCRCFPFHFPLCVKSQAFAFYSDDCGTMWYVGERLSTESCECEMAEIIDQESRSELYCNARSTKGHRVEALSENSGSTFDRPHFAKKLVEPCHGCQGSVVSFAALEEQENGLPSNTKTWLLYSHPTQRRKRMDLGVYLNKSPLSGSAWSKPWIIHHGPSGYSDLAPCEEPDCFACLLECGEKSELEEIAFVEFPLTDIMNN
ncbi:sialidase-3-like isoform X2 [Neoarius graeffei]|uniref:sialidase-3-like isoform X2 n=1 Tax=Neoarius graeffei TaxID=443677 RepID=UPI00298D5AD2|nr:sialidase-3-like isoform X2 [Neoarius graeffei]